MDIDKITINIQNHVIQKGTIFKVLNTFEKTVFDLDDDEKGHIERYATIQILSHKED